MERVGDQPTLFLEGDHPCPAAPASDQVLAHLTALFALELAVDERDAAQQTLFGD